MSADPYKQSGYIIDPQSWNRYSYSRNDPINLFDPLGLDFTSVGANIGATLTNATTQTYSSTIYGSSGNIVTGSFYGGDPSVALLFDGGDGGGVGPTQVVDSWSDRLLNRAKELLEQAGGYEGLTTLWKALEDEKCALAIITGLSKIPGLVNPVISGLAAAVDLIYFYNKYAVIIATRLSNEAKARELADLYSSSMAEKFDNPIGALLQGALAVAADAVAAKLGTVLMAARIGLGIGGALGSALSRDPNAYKRVKQDCKDYFTLPDLGPIGED